MEDIMRTKVVLGCWLVVVVVGSLGCFCYPPTPQHRINKEGFEDIRFGMTLTEVEDVLGGPPGDYGRSKGEILDSVCGSSLSNAIEVDPNGKNWLASEFAITVCFDDEGRVTGKGTALVYRPYDTFFEMLQQQVGLIPKKC
jgi:hypothetical protein